ncbi:MAG TPA: thrombospondin type 3 repeat-containing protein [Planctomycetota bacterium]|nr:thrombospondin type 3 repeat-containing protein [Planctomycetota bacterium]
MSRKVKVEIVAILAACLTVGLMTNRSLAQKPFLTRLVKVYALEKEKNGNCKICHDYDTASNEVAEKGNINAIGKELAKLDEFKPVIGKGHEHKFTPQELNAVEAAWKVIAAKDTDGDGATNDEELALGTYPANPGSTPSKDALEKYRAARK